MFGNQIEEEQITSSGSINNKAMRYPQISKLLQSLMPQSSLIKKQYCFFQDFLDEINLGQVNDFYYWGNLSDLWKYVIKEKILEPIIRNEVTITGDICFSTFLIYFSKIVGVDEKLHRYFQKKLSNYQKKMKDIDKNEQFGSFIKIIFNQKKIDQLNSEKILNVIKKGKARDEQEQNGFFKFTYFVISQLQSILCKAAKHEEKIGTIIILKYLSLGARYPTYEKYVFAKIRISSLVFYHVFKPKGAKKLLNFLIEAPLKILEEEYQGLNKYT